MLPAVHRQLFVDRDGHAEPFGFQLFNAANACGLTAGGDAWCWGDNAWGTLGDGTRTSRFAPVAVALPGARRVREIAVAGQICALADDDTVWCWGHNDHGQVGDGSTEDRLTPVQIPVDWR
jgi:hypothetical protein